jgi:hypothetical protein
VTPEQRNQRNVLIDAIGVGITAGVGSFLSVFMVRLGATDFQVGLLTAMPALTGMCHLAGDNIPPVRGIGDHSFAGDRVPGVRGR